MLLSRVTLKVKKRIRRRSNLGEFLKKLRKENNMDLNEASALLSMKDIPCSHANLSRIENGITSCRSDIVAGLSVIYGVSTEDILFYGAKK